MTKAGLLALVCLSAVFSQTPKPKARTLAASTSTQHKVEYSPYFWGSCGTLYITKNGVTTVDEEQTAIWTKQLAEDQKKKEDLWWALRTRKLSRIEMEQVRKWDYHMLEPMCRSFDPKELQVVFMEGLRSQLFIQAASSCEESRSGSKP